VQLAVISNVKTEFTTVGETFLVRHAYVDHDLNMTIYVVYNNKAPGEEAKLRADQVLKVITC
jgi:hypothetical protein